MKHLKHSSFQGSLISPLLQQGVEESQPYLRYFPKLCCPWGRQVWCYGGTSAVSNTTTVTGMTWWFWGMRYYDNISYSFSSMCEKSCFYLVTVPEQVKVQLRQSSGKLFAACLSNLWLGLLRKYAYLMALPPTRPPSWPLQTIFIFFLWHMKKYERKHWFVNRKSWPVKSLRWNSSLSVIVSLQSLL